MVSVSWLLFKVWQINIVPFPNSRLYLSFSYHDMLIRYIFSRLRAIGQSSIATSAAHSLSCRCLCFLFHKLETHLLVWLLRLMWTCIFIASPLGFSTPGIEHFLRQVSTTLALAFPLFPSILTTRFENSWLWNQQLQECFIVISYLLQEVFLVIGLVFF